MDRLATYRTKRQFEKTPEPEGVRGKSSRGGLYVIHEHDATRLHYDLRLEHDGVLLSWAVTRGPSLDPEEKRLAVQVEDHPLDYGAFEGTIPEGNYGAGTVSQWDRGRWIPEGDTAKGLKKGHLVFRLEGEKLKGGWHLVRMKRRPKEKRDNWLLIKSKDEYAVAGAKGEVTKAATRSVKTGRTLAEIAEGRKAKPREPAPRKPAKAGAKTKAAKADPEPARRGGAKPVFVPPCLARLDKTPAGREWLHEVKFDGYRIQAIIDGWTVRLMTRTGLDWTKRFGREIAAELQALPCEKAVIDGEIVVLSDAGVADFSALQEDLSEGRSNRFVFYVFDLLHLDGVDLKKRPLTERKEALERLFGDEVSPSSGSVRYSEHFDEDGELMLDQACRLGLEGVVSKRRDAPYRSGRTGDWIKSKCSQRQEFVVAGYVPSTASRSAIGSLVVGYFEDGRLRPAGRVGTGYSQKVASDLKRRLDKLKTDRSPFATRQPGDRQVVWVEPRLVAEVEFRAWTADGILRHAAFVAIRDDKPVEEVVREGKTAKAPAPAKAAKTPTTAIVLSHPDRVLWPEAGLTKQGLLDHYAAVWSWMKPYVVDRPLSLLRAPGGIGGSQLFFQKHRSRGMPDAIGEVKDPKDGEGLIVIRDFDGLAALVQFGVVEVHLWGSTTAALETPDQMIFDLDPDKGVGWEAVVEAAKEIRKRLAALKLSPFLKTSGGKGLHVVVPLKPDADWAAVKDFSHGFAELLARDFPARYTANMSKKARPGRIFIDYLRNGRGATAVAPYSTRARAKAPVAVPIEWSELDLGVRADQFRVDNLMSRLDHLGKDPWAGFRKAAKPLPKLK